MHHIENDSVSAFWSTAYWTPQIPGELPIAVPIRYLSNSQEPTLHFYPGYGEETNAAESVMGVLSEMDISAAVIILPFHYLLPNPLNIERTIVEAPHEMVKLLNSGKSVDVAGNSQGAGVAVKTASEAPELFDKVAALGPIGLNGEFLIKEGNPRRVLLKRLLITNNLRPDQNPFRDRSNLVAVREVTARGISDILRGIFNLKIDTAVEFDLSDNLVKLVIDHLVRIFLMEHDPVFPPNELGQVLGRIGCQNLVEVLPGSHSPMINRMGRQHVASVGGWVKSVNPKPSLSTK